jgi:hypothetical protein
VKTDDRVTRQPNEAEGNEATVVRLSDWLAPDDELVPFGPRAHTTTREPNQPLVESDAESPAASGFWDGDTSMHTAVPSPGLFDEPGERGERTADHASYRRPALIRRPALPSLHPFGWLPRARDGVADLVDRISSPWAAGGLAFVALIAVVLVATLGLGSSGHRETAAQAGVGDQPGGATLSGTLGEIGTSGRAVAITDLRPLPPVDTAGRAIGTAAQRARPLEVRHRPDAVVASTSVSSTDASTVSSVQTPTTTETPTGTTPAPTETEPVQTTPTPPPPSGGGGSSSGGGSSTGSQQQPAFGATGSLGPGSSPNG